MYKDHNKYIVTSHKNEHIFSIFEQATFYSTQDSIKSKINTHKNSKAKHSNERKECTT